VGFADDLVGVRLMQMLFMQIVGLSGIVTWFVLSDRLK
jgi:hypothetical protein